jgi:hypothetical protein
MMFREIITVYSENRMKLINPISRQNAELLNIKAVGTRNSAFKVWDLTPRILALRMEDKVTRLES